MMCPPTQEDNRRIGLPSLKIRRSEGRALMYSFPCLRASLRRRAFPIFCTQLSTAAKLSQSRGYFVERAPRAGCFSLPTSQPPPALASSLSPPLVVLRVPDGSASQPARRQLAQYPALPPHADLDVSNQTAALRTYADAITVPPITHDESIASFTDNRGSTCERVLLQ